MTTFASMQTNNRLGFVPIAGDHHRSPQVTHLKCAAGQTFVAGDLVKFSANEIVVADASTTEFAGVAASGRDNLGFAAIYTDPDQIYVARIDAATAAGAGSTLDITGASNRMQLDANVDTVHQIVLLGPVNPEESNAAGQQWHVRLCKLALVEVSA